MITAILLTAVLTSIAPQEGEVIIPEINLPVQTREVDVPVTVKGIKGVISVWLEIEFDPSALEAEKISYSDLTRKMMRSGNVVEGRVIVAMACTRPRDMDGELLKIKFKLSDKIREGAALKLKISRADFNEGEIKVRVKDGLIKIGTPSPVAPRFRRVATWGWMKRRVR